jgi:hypothetical protein
MPELHDAPTAPRKLYTPATRMHRPRLYEAYLMCTEEAFAALGAHGVVVAVVVEAAAWKLLTDLTGDDKLEPDIACREEASAATRLSAARAGSGAGLTGHSLRRLRNCHQLG